MTRATTPKQGLGARPAGRALGVSHSYLLRLAKEGRLPRHDDGTFDIEECRRLLRTMTDPAQVRTANPDRWSPGNQPKTGAGTTPRFEGFTSDPRPDPADYRNRTDLPDDFARGALFGAHAVAFEVPHAVAYSVMEQGCTHAEQVEAYRAERDVVFLLVKEPMVAVGVEGEDADEPTALSPTRFMGFTVGGGTG